MSVCLVFQTTRLEGSSPTEGGQESSDGAGVGGEVMSPMEVLTPVHEGAGTGHMGLPGGKNCALGTTSTCTRWELTLLQMHPHEHPWAFHCLTLTKVLPSVREASRNTKC